MSDINEIQSEILGYIQESESLTALEILTEQEVQITDANSDSKAAFWRRWVRILAKAIWAFEQRYLIFREETNTIINQSRIHNRDWYKEVALEYQHGHELVGLNYDNTAYTDAQIAISKIIKHASVIKYVISGRGVLRMKLAKMNDSSELEKLIPSELTGFRSYIDKKTDAGSFVIPTSGDPDDLKLELDIYYDATILDNQGRRLDGTNDTPIIEAINLFLKSLDFDGRFIKTKVTDHLQQIQGVSLPVVKNAWSKYGNYTYADSVLNVGVISEIRTADAGYFKLDITSSVINYIPFVE